MSTPLEAARTVLDDPLVCGDYITGQGERLCAAMAHAIVAIDGILHETLTPGQSVTAFLSEKTSRIAIILGTPEQSS